MHDVVVIGAGPVGLACAIEAQGRGLSALVIDKGTLVNSIVGYPARMEFFSTPELIEIGGYPVSRPALQADARGRDRVLPRRRARARPSSYGSTKRRRVARQRTVASRSRPPTANTAPRTSSSRRASSTCRNRLDCSRRGSAEGDPLLRGAVRLRRPEGGGHRRAEFRSQGGARLLPARRGGHARRPRHRRSPRRSSTGSSRTSRTASRKAASARCSTRRSRRSGDDVDRVAHTRRRAKRSRTTGCSR